MLLKGGYQSGALLKQVTIKITYTSNVENEANLNITYTSYFSKYYFYRCLRIQILLALNNFHSYLVIFPLIYKN